jgi:putative glutamine amidotransferase
MKPLIGIPARTSEDSSDGLTRFVVTATYTRAVEMAGGAPVVIPLRLGEETLRDIFARLDGLLLAGGVDVHPSEYGEAVEPYCGSIDDARDAVELRMIRWALDSKMPLLGICRGIQMINVAAGGSLYQDIPAQLENKLRHQHVKGNPYHLPVHSLEIDPASQLARALRVTKIEVNSLHHQSVKRVAPDFYITARAPDGIIEGIEARNGHFAVGVQFHPELMVDHDARMMGIFRELINATKVRSST